MAENVNMMIRVPAEMKDRMNAHPSISWSEVAREAFENRLGEFGGGIVYFRAVTIEHLAKVWLVAPETLLSASAQGIIPQPVIVGSVVGWPETHVERWNREHLFVRLLKFEVTGDASPIKDDAEDSKWHDAWSERRHASKPKGKRTKGRANWGPTLEGGE